MAINYKIIGTPVENVTLAEARLHCRIDADTSDGHPDDSLITMYISVAREYCERFTGLVLAQKSILQVLDSFEDEIELLSPVSYIASIKYYDADEVLQTVDAADYVLNTYLPEPSTVSPAYGAVWPTPGAMPKAVELRYVTGYYSDSDSQPLPYVAKAAILLMVGHLYENREDTTERALTNIPNGVHALLRPLRIDLGMA